MKSVAVVKVIADGRAAQSGQIDGLALVHELQIRSQGLLVYRFPGCLLLPDQVVRDLLPEVVAVSEPWQGEGEGGGAVQRHGLDLRRFRRTTEEEERIANRHFTFKLDDTVTCIASSSVRKTET